MFQRMLQECRAKENGESQITNTRGNLQWTADAIGFFGPVKHPLCLLVFSIIQHSQDDIASYHLFLFGDLCPIRAGEH